MPWKALKIGNLTVDQSLERATYLVDSYNDKTGLVARLEATRGRPRAVPWRAFLILAQFHFLHNGNSGQLEQIKNSALLVQHRWGSLGIDATVHVAYEHIESSLEDMRRLFEPSDSPHRFDAHGTSKGWRDVGLDIDDFTASYLANSVDDRFTSTEYAFDATHYETWARNFSLNEENARQHEDDPVTYRTAPVVGHDGRLRYSKDLDARPGQYTNTRAGARADDNITNGFDIEGWCMIPPLGGEPLPSFTVGMGLRPMGPPDMTQLGKIIDALDRAGRPVSHAVFDKGYVHRLELPGILLDRSVTKTVDLLPVHLGTHPADGGQALWIDGGLFSIGTYRGLWDIGSIDQRVNQDLKARRIAQYDKRAAFAYTPKGAPALGGNGWTQDFRGPALTGRVRCLNYEPSLTGANSGTKPLTECPASAARMVWEARREQHLTHRDVSAATGISTADLLALEEEDRKLPREQLGTLARYLGLSVNSLRDAVGCTCGRSIRVGDRFAQTRQRNIYGTTQWKADYGRRSGIESAHSMYKGHITKIERGFTRVFGLIKNALLLTFTLAATNVLMARRWTLKRLEQDPMTVRLGEAEHAFHPSLLAKKRLPKQAAAHRMLIYDYGPIGQAANDVVV